MSEAELEVEAELEKLPQRKPVRDTLRLDRKEKELHKLQLDRTVLQCQLAMVFLRVAQPK